MKLYPVISRPLFKNNDKAKHNVKKTDIVKSNVVPQMKCVIRNNPRAEYKDTTNAADVLLKALMIIFNAGKKIKGVTAHYEVIKFSFNKYKRFIARQNRRKRKLVLQSYTEPVSKQKNLEEMVADLEFQESLRVHPSNTISHHDIAIWVMSLKRQEENKLRMKNLSEENINKQTAKEYFAENKRKNLQDADFLKSKTFAMQRREETIDLEELYETTSSLREVIHVFNKSKYR